MKPVLKWSLRIFCVLACLFFVFWGVFICVFADAPESGIPITAVGVVVITIPMLPWKRILKL